MSGLQMDRFLLITMRVKLREKVRWVRYIYTGSALVGNYFPETDEDYIILSVMV